MKYSEYHRFDVGGRHPEEKVMSPVLSCPLGSSGLVGCALSLSNESAIYLVVLLADSRPVPVAGLAFC